MANRINNVKKTTTNYQAPVIKDGKLSYSLYNSNGEKVGNTLVDPGTDMSNASNMYFTKGSDGLYTMSDKPSASISLNKDTKNISIEAPKGFLESTYYKEQVKPTLESYSQAYKLNSEAKFPVSSEEGAEEHDIQWYIDEVNKEISDMVSVELSRQRESKKAGHELSFDDLKTMNTTAVTYKDASGEEHKVTDADRQVIPNIPEANFLKEALGDAFDKDTNTVDYRTLMDEAWNREKQSDENIIKLIETVDDYFERGDFSNTELYSQMYSFRNFMNQQNPHTGFWRGLGDFASNIGYGALTGAAGFWSGAFEVTEGVMNFAGQVGTSAATGKWEDEPATGKSTFWKEVAGDLKDLTDKHAERASYLNRAGGATYSITNAITPFVIQMVVGNGLTKAATDSLTAVATARTVKLVDDAKNAADSIEKTVYSIYAGTNLLMDAMSTEQAAQATVAALSNLSTIAEAINSGAALAEAANVTINGVKAAKWAVEIASDAVIDCALGKPDVVRAILDGDDQEHKNMLLNELGTNMIFWGVTRGVGKISKAAKKTDVGRTIRAQSSAWANRISARVGNATDKIKSWVFGDDWKDQLIAKRDAMAKMGNSKKAEKLTQKIQTLGNRQTVRKEQEILGKMSIFDGSDDVMENVKKMEKQILNVKKAQVMWDDSNLRRATSQMFDTLTNSDFDPEFKGAFDAYMNQLKEVISAENAAGFAADLSKKGALSGAGEKGIRVLDQRTINYFNAKIHLSYDREYGDVALNELNRFVKAFEDSASPELKRATDLLIEKYRNAYSNLHRIGLAEDLGLNFYNANEIAELNNTRGFNNPDGFMFGENGSLYGKTMRVSDFDDWEQPLSRGVSQNRSTVLSHAMNTASGTGDFVDPTYVLCTDITDKSRIAVSQGNARILSTLPGVNTEIRVGAAATEQARLYKTDGYANAIKSQMSAISDDFETSGILNNIMSKGEAGKVMVKGNLHHDGEFLSELDEMLDNYVDDLYKTKGGNNVFNRLSSHAGNLQEKEFEYLALSSLSGNSSELIDDIGEKARKHYKDFLTNNAKNMSEEEINKLSSELVDELKFAMKNRIDGRAADLAGELLENGSDLVDTNKLYTDITDAIQDIEGAKAAQDVVKVYDINGKETWVKMDPLVADIFNNRPMPTDMSKFQKLNNFWNRVFRLGTTGANLKSFMAQNVKDFGNAWVAGGADATIKEITRHLTDELGEEIVSQIQQFEPSVYSQLERKAAETGEDLASLAVERELSIGRAISPSATGTEAFSFTAENRAARFGESSGRYYQTSGYQRFSNRLDKIMEGLEYPNSARETYLRDLTYSNGFSDAIEAGETIKDARYSARFLMNNGTTNFGREMYHLNNLRNSVPYLGAAVNGTKSFWRLWSLDPVGVTGRIMGGIAIPVVYLTGQSLSTEENRRIWKNIPEYQKDGNLIFITHGQIVSVPLPEELGGFINPIRQFVEYLHGVDPASFQELMLNDIIGLQPFNLDGFVMYDRNRLLADPTIWDRIGTGVSKFSAQVMPPMIKSAVIYMTGKDPYTGKEIPRGRVYIDPDTGEEMVMDYTSGSFAKWLSGLFGDNVSAPMAQKLLQNLIGNAGVDVINGLWGLGQQITSGDWQGAITEPELLDNLTKEISDPFNIPSYSLANSQWTQAVSYLNQKKLDILNNETYQNALKGMSNAKTNKEYENYKKVKQNMLDEYYDLVLNTSNRLVAQNPGAFDSSKFAAVIALMNMDTTTYNRQTGTRGENAYNDYLQDELKQSGKSAAISTMAELGFHSASPTSIFGYYYEDDNGDVITLWTDPLTILNMKRTLSGADDINWANIHSAIKSKNLWDKKDKYKEQVNSIYAKDKLSNADYNKIDAIWVQWDGEVMQAIDPYVQRMTPEQAINNTKVLNELASLMEVPGDYKKDKYGRWVTNSKLGNGSAKQAYIRNYIKDIYNINDTGYAGGKNYSDRK